jgi:hypothetical protein
VTADTDKSPGQIAAAGVSADVKVRSITQSAIAVAIIGSMLWLFVSTGTAPDGLIAIAGGVVGWYFRGVIVNPSNGETKP